MALSASQKASVSQIASLVVANAMVFQELLSEHKKEVETLNKTLLSANPQSAFLSQWQSILTLDYVPIFQAALNVLAAMPANPDLDRALRNLAERALQIISHRAALRHDVMGRIYHTLLREREAKGLATYYTSVPAATMLLKLALEPARWSHVDWSDEKDISKIRVADLACGTGTLLMAAAEAIVDNYSAASAWSGTTPALDKLHRILVEQVLWGYDVLTSATHLTASTLASRAPKVDFNEMNIWTLPLGGHDNRLGSIEYFENKKVQLPLDPMHAASTRVTPKGRVSYSRASLPKLDLCVMNPPFARSSQAGLLFGSVPDSERKGMQLRLSKLLRQHKVEANSTAGLGAVFVALGDRYIKPGGRIALVLPKALLAGIAWTRTRKLLTRNYVVEAMAVSHDPSRWNFSENTKLSEVLLIARKLTDTATVDDGAYQVLCVNLWRNPVNSWEALGVARSAMLGLNSGSVPDIDIGQGGYSIQAGGAKMGEAMKMRWSELGQQHNWLLPCAYAQNVLARVTRTLLTGEVRLPGELDSVNIPLVALGKIATLGPAARDVNDAFSLEVSPTPYAAFWGHPAHKVKTMSQTPNMHLAPLAAPKHERTMVRPLRDANLIWSRAGRIQLSARTRLNSKALTAIRLDQDALSDVWWPVKLGTPKAKRISTEKRLTNQEKALTLWFNSTLGMLLLLCFREDTEGAWIQFKKPSLEACPVLDITTLKHQVIDQLAEVYDSLCHKSLSPFPGMGSDPVRAELDSKLGEVIGLPDMKTLRECLAREPFICLRPMVS